MVKLSCTHMDEISSDCIQHAEIVDMAEVFIYFDFLDNARP